MIDLEGLLEAVHGSDGAGEHAARVVRQHVDAAAARLQLGSESAHIIQPSVIGDVIFGPDAVGDRLGFLRRATDQNQPCAARGKLTARRRPDAVAGTGDHDGCSGKIGHMRQRSTSTSQSWSRT